MSVHIKLAIIAAIMAALLGSPVAWCDSCGEMWDATDLSTCSECGATVCPVCAGLYDGAGCLSCGL